MPQIALYARQSVEKDNSVSISTQLDHCRSMIRPEERNFEITEYADKGFSGGSLERDAFRELMKKIEQGKVKKVIVYRLDRISRSLPDFLNILSLFRRHNVEFISASEAFDTASPYGELTVKILAVFAEFERNSIIARVSQAYEHRSRMQIYMGGRLPFGFELEPVTISNIQTKRFKPVPEEAEQVRYIYKAYAAEGVTLAGLQKSLIEKGVFPSSGAFSTASLSALIRNPLYVRADSAVYNYFKAHGTEIVSPPESFDGIHGLQLYGKTKHDTKSNDWSDMKLVVMTHEGLVDSEVWLRCRQKLSLNKKVGAAVSNKSSWLSGKVICASCGYTMTTTKGKRGNGDVRIYFSCTGKSRLKKCTGVHVTVYAESLEEMVYSEITSRLSGLKDICFAEKKPPSPELNELRNKLNALEISENKIADMLLRSDITPDLFDIMGKRAAGIRADRAEICARIEELECGTHRKNPSINLPRKWKNASFEEKRGVCNILISKILIEKNGDTEIVWNLE